MSRRKLSIRRIYHVDDARSFAQQDNRWETPNDPQNENQLQAPYYMSMKMPGQDEAKYSMFTTFIPSSQGANSRNVLMGYLAVESDAGSEKGKKSDSYGTLRMLEIDADTTVPGPGQVQNTFNSDTGVSQQLNVLKIGQSQVLHGNLLTLPVGGGLLYVQPVYVQSSEGTKLPRLQKILVAFGDRIAFADTLTAALDELFGGDAGATAGDDEVPDESDAGGTDDGSTAPPSIAEQRMAALDDAKTAMLARDEALKAGDLAAFAEADKALTEAVNRLVALEGDTEPATD